MIILRWDTCATSNVQYKTASRLLNQCQCGLFQGLKNDSTMLLLRNKSSSPENLQRASRKRRYAVALFAATSLGVIAYRLRRRSERPCPGDGHRHLPWYTEAEVAEQRNGVWLTYKGGVYDLTEYAKRHPGGEGIITAAAGGALEPYWREFAVHQKPEVHHLLEKMRIGNLKADGEKSWKPARCKVKKNVPRIELKDYKLDFAIESETVKSLKFEDVKQYPKHSIVSAIPCKSTQNEKGDEKVETKKGPTWSGTQLRDILRDLGLNLKDYAAVRFECMDKNKSGVAYGSTVPIDAIVDPTVDLLLAYEMDGAELTPEHGFPLRLVMPQVAGARNVKWISKIVFLKKLD